MSTPVFDATLDQFGGTPVFWVILVLDLHERFDTLMARFALTEEANHPALTGRPVTERHARICRE